MGPLAPHHKRPLLDAFLRGARDPDAFVRASSLSNLGELCALLRYSIDPVLHEVHYSQISCSFSSTIL